MGHANVLDRPIRSPAGGDDHSFLFDQRVTAPRWRKLEMPIWERWYLRIDFGHGPWRCGVSIARGSLGGWWPWSGFSPSTARSIPGSLSQRWRHGRNDWDHTEIRVQVLWQCDGIGDRVARPCRSLKVGGERPERRA